MTVKLVLTLTLEVKDEGEDYAACFMAADMSTALTQQASFQEAVSDAGMKLVHVSSHVLKNDT